MTEARIEDVVMFLGDTPDVIKTSYGTTTYSKEPFALLRISGLSVYVKDSSPATLRKIAACAEELATWLEQQAAINARTSPEGGGSDAA